MGEKVTTLYPEHPKLTKAASLLKSGLDLSCRRYYLRRNR